MGSIANSEIAVPGKDDNFETIALWEGPSVVTSIRTSKTKAFKSLLQNGKSQEPSAIAKGHRDGLVRLNRLGFEGDEQAYVDHGGVEKAILQYNPDHYRCWKEELKEVPTIGSYDRNAVLDVGGFGENLATEDALPGPRMDETTMCVGDVLSIRSRYGERSERARIQVTGPRQPCFKLNHRFGVANMAQRAQEKMRTGWLYRVLAEGETEVGDEMVLLERPFPSWSVARVQYYLYKEPKNFEMIRHLLEVLGHNLVWDVREVLENRLRKGIENMQFRLLGQARPDLEGEQWVNFRLLAKRQETSRVSDFTFERVDKLSEMSSDLAVATPGSHIRLRFSIPDQGNPQLIRSYSVIAGDSNNFRLGVALADESRGGSSYLHQILQVGALVEVSNRFANTFPLQTADEVDEHVFLAGGIGITAFLDHMRHCVKHNLRFHLHYMIRNESDCAFESFIEDLMGDDEKQQHSRNSTGKVSYYVSSKGSRCDVKALLSQVAGKNRTHVYVCGSEKLADSVRENARAVGLNGHRLHFEQFSIDASGDPFTVELLESKKTVEVASEESLLDALRDAGLGVASSCEAGNCGTCKVRVKSGRILHKGTGLPDDEKAGYDGQEEGDMLSCVSRGKGKICLEL